MDVFLLYLWTRLDSLVAVATIGALVLGMGTAATGIAYGIGSVDREEWAPRVGAVFRRFVTGLAVCVLLLILTPSSKDAIYIMGGAAVLEAAKTEQAQRLASKSVQLIEQTLDGYLKQKDAKQGR